MQGTVIKSTGSWYTVRAESGQVYECRIKGKFRIKGLSTTNPVAVGDQVDFDPETGVIGHLHERKNYIIRKATNLSKQAHVIAANLDQTLLVVTLAQPRTSLGFIDRFLVTAEAYEVPAVLLFNKTDIYTDEGLETQKSIKNIYENIGYQCLELSALHAQNLDVLKERLKHKTTLFSGHSGVGKSTLINRLIPKLSLKTANISDASSKGVHTTTFAEMHTLPFGGEIIDTPGINEFGLIDIANEELSHFFVEMRKRFNQCKFDNCRHVNEPGCAVIRAVENEEIALSRYESYLSMYQGFDTRG